MIPGPEENSIIELFSQEDEAATRRIYDFFYRPLCYYADTIIHNKQEAEDIAVESFVKLLHKRKDFSSLSGIRAFLYTAARNACIDFLRKEKRHRQSHHEIEYLSEPVSLPDHIEISAEVLATLYREIEALPPQCAAIFRLLFFQQLTTAQVAAQLEISAKTVLNQKGKAIQLLRKAILQEGILPLSALLAFIQTH